MCNTVWFGLFAVLFFGFCCCCRPLNASTNVCTSGLTSRYFVVGFHVRFLTKHQIMFNIIVLSISTSQLHYLLQLSYQELRDFAEIYKQHLVQLYSEVILKNNEVKMCAGRHCTVQNDMITVEGFHHAYATLMHKICSFPVCTAVGLSWHQCHVCITVVHHICPTYQQQRLTSYIFS